MDLKNHKKAVTDLICSGFCNDYHCSGDCGLPHDPQELIDMIDGLRLEHGMEPETAKYKDMKNGLLKVSY